MHNRSHSAYVMYFIRLLLFATNSQELSFCRVNNDLIAISDFNISDFFLDNAVALSRCEKRSVRLKKKK